MQWQKESGKDSHKVAYRKWWLKSVGLPQVGVKLKELPSNRPLTKQEEARKQGYLAKEERYKKELAQLVRLKPGARRKGKHGQIYPKMKEKNTVEELLKRFKG